MQHKVGFTTGINKDLSKDKYANTSYYHANNVKVITSGGLSTGSIENEKGNALLFSFPTVGARYKVTIASDDVVIGGHTVTLTSGDSNETTYNKIIANAGVAGLITLNQVYVFFNDTGVYIQVLDTAFTVTGTITTYSPATSDIYICGWERLNEHIIVFTSDTETAEPSSALCQIWKFNFTSGSRTAIENATTNGTLVSTAHLIYNDYLNYSTETYIRDIVANYETSSKGRVYWTDYYNQIRVMNVLDSTSMEIKANDLGLVAEVTLSKPIITSVENISNGLPSGAHYQYFYKLLDTDGRESIFSPGSQLIDVQEELSTNSSISYYQLDSSPAGTANNKLINISISDIDQDYNVIELYAVIWESLDSPSIYKVTDSSVSGTTMTFSHSSLDGNINIPVSEFMEIGIPFTAKTIEDRDKVLTAGNIKETKFDLDFDARAYRFNSSQKVTLLDSSGNVEYSAVTAASILAGSTVIANDADAVNPTNDDTIVAYNYDSGAAKQIYQDDGSTIGGTGLNIEYSFTTNGRNGSSGSNALADDIDATDEGYNISEVRVGGSTYSSGVQKLDGTSLEVDLTNEFSNNKSTMINASFTGYARGEVYRFGIVFYSKSGQRSYVKWIGDIKFPDPSLDSTYKVSDSPSSTSACENVPADQSQTAINTTNYNIGISFDIDISSIQSNISGYEIVRVHRDASDRTRLGTGVVTNYVDFGTGDGQTGPSTNNNAGSLMRKYAKSTANFYPLSINTKNAWTNDNEQIDSQIEVNGTRYGDSSSGGLGTPETTVMLADHPTILGTSNTNNLEDYSRTLLNFTGPCSEFRNYTGFDVNTSTDFIRDYGYYECKEYVYNDDAPAGPDASHENLKNAPVGFIYRAKKYVAASAYQNYRMAAERLLTDGAIVFADGSVSDDATLLSTPLSGTNTVQLLCNTSYTFNNTTSDDYTPFGIGTTKQFIRLDTTTSGHITSGTSLDIKTTGAFPTAYQNEVQYFKEVAYCREVTNQYGGSSYEARSKNVYITTGAYQIINNDSATSHTTTAYGGDTHVVSYDREYMRQYIDGILDPSPFKDSISTKLSIGFIFSAESPVNTAWRTGEHFGGESAGATNYFRGSISTSLTKGDLSRSEDFKLDARHQQSNNSRTDYIAKDFLAQSENIFPNRIKVSRTKLDGELTDSWRSFPANQFDDVDGSLGQIHKLIAHKDQLIFFQDRGVGAMPINERAVIEDVTGAELILGDGQLIGKYKYLTETSGTKHQHSVVSSDRAIYYYDSLQQKIYAVQGDSLTEALGLSAYFHNSIKEIVRDSDDLYISSPIGVHSVYDKRNERILFTFLNAGVITDTTGKVVTNYYDVGDIILNSGSYYECIKQGTYLTSEIIVSNNFKQLSNYQNSITLGYRERLQKFESFYDFKPGKYLNFDDKLLSTGTTRNNGYIHEEGNYGTFYGNTFDSDITLVVMPNPNIISIFNNIEYYSELTLNKADIVGETLDSILCWNEHQNTGQISLTVGTLAKRRIRTWRHKLKRDTLTTSNNAVSNPRMRNYYMLMKLSFTNNNNKKLILSDIVISYTPTKM